jgi:hypothetical protein
MGTGPYTVEGWLLAEQFVNNVIYARASPTSFITRETMWYTTSTTTISQYYGIRGSSNTVYNFTVPTMLSGSWYHLAWSRDEYGNIRAFLNGTQSVTTPPVDAIDLSAPTTLGVGVGGFPAAATTGIRYLSDVRVTIGKCRYYTSFVIPKKYNPNY